MRICLILIASCLIYSFEQARAFELSNLYHIPPTLNEGDDLSKSLVLAIPTYDLKRARVLVAVSNGYRALEMKKDAANFITSVKFEELAVIKYQFQMESNEGKVFLSDFYSIRQPANKKMEDQIYALSLEIESLNAQESQLKNRIHALKTADSSGLSKRKSQELAKALLHLGKKEREHEEILSQSQKLLSEYAQKLSASEYGKVVLESREFIRNDSKHYW